MKERMLSIRVYEESHLLSLRIIKRILFLPHIHSTHTWGISNSIDSQCPQGPPYSCEITLNLRKDASFNNFEILAEVKRTDNGTDCPEGMLFLRLQNMEGKKSVKYILPCDLKGDQTVKNVFKIEDEHYKDLMIRKDERVVFPDDMLIIRISLTVFCRHPETNISEEKLIIPGTEQKTSCKPEQNTSSRSEPNAGNRIKQNSVRETKQNAVRQIEQNVVSQTEQNVRETEQNDARETDQNDVRQTEQNVFIQTEQNIVKETKQNTVRETKRNAVRKAKQNAARETEHKAVVQTEQKALVQTEQKAVVQTEQKSVVGRRLIAVSPTRTDCRHSTRTENADNLPEQNAGGCPSRQQRVRIQSLNQTRVQNFPRAVYRHSDGAQNYNPTRRNDRPPISPEQNTSKRRR